MDNQALLTALAILAAVAAVLVIFTFYGRRAGYRFGGDTIVRCNHGHLFTTVWLPGVSLKSVRLGMIRFQRCPVGDHWAFVRPVKEADLSDSQIRLAAERRDSNIP